MGDAIRTRCTGFTVAASRSETGCAHRLRLCPCPSTRTGSGPPPSRPSRVSPSLWRRSTNSGRRSVARGSFDTLQSTTSRSPRCIVPPEVTVAEKPQRSRSALGSGTEELIHRFARCAIPPDLELDRTDQVRCISRRVARRRLGSRGRSSPGIRRTADRPPPRGPTTPGAPRR